MSTTDRQSDIGAVFGRAAASYDAGRRRLIPCFDEFYAAALELVTEAAPPGARILDLGAGTGLLTALVADTRPDCDFTLTDLSEEMMDRARARFADRPDSVHFRAMNHLDLDETAAYDVVMSALSIHHLEDDGKRRLYAACARALKPGGRFVNADQVSGDDAAMEARYWHHWYDRVVASGIGRTEIDAAIERQKFDRRAPLGPQLDWLREAGLGAVECRYKNVSFVVISGDRG